MFIYHVAPREKKAKFGLFSVFKKSKKSKGKLVMSLNI